jgi:hypothetical protein
VSAPPGGEEITPSPLWGEGWDEGGTALFSLDTRKNLQPLNSQRHEVGNKWLPGGKRCIQQTNLLIFMGISNKSGWAYQHLG